MTKQLCENRRARFNYEILETLEAGLILMGTEIKSLRNNGGSIAESYVSITKGEAYLKNASIAPYSLGSDNNYEEKRERKLLLHKNEIDRLEKALQQKGHTIIPLSLYLKSGRAKLKIAIGRGKKAHDKRSDIKKREQEREISRAMKT